MVVNEVFALELFLKALLRLRGKPAIQGHVGHDVQLLFDALDAEDKRRISKIFLEIVKLHPDYQWALEQNVSFEVEDVLERKRETFKRIR